MISLMLSRISHLLMTMQQSSLLRLVDDVDPAAPKFTELPSCRQPAQQLSQEPNAQVNVELCQSGQFAVQVAGQVSRRNRRILVNAV